MARMVWSEGERWLKKILDQLNSNAKLYEKSIDYQTAFTFMAVNELESIRKTLDKIEKKLPTLES